MDPFSQYQSMPHDQVNWAALAQQWMAMKEPQYGHDGNWEAAPRGKPIFPSATNIRFNGNECQPPPPPSNSYGRPPPPNFQPRAGPSNSDIRFDANSGPPPPPPPSNHYGRPTPPNFPPRADPGDWTSSRNEDWRVPPHGWNQGPPRIPQASTRTFFPPPPRPMNGAPLPPLMGLRPPPPPIEDDWGFGWTPPPPQIQQKPTPPPPLFASASTAPPVPLFPPAPQAYHQNFAAPENAPSPEVPFFSGDTHLDDNARNKLPAWIREGLEKAELEKKKQAEKEERIRLAEEEKRKRRELAGKSKFDSDSSDEDDVDDSYSTEKQEKHEAKESEPHVTAEDLQEQAMLFIRQFMTKILTEGTDELLRATCLEAMREAEKAKAEPKLLTKSSALAALSSLGDDDEETDSDTDEKHSTNNGADNNKPGDDFIFKAPIGIPKNFIKTSEQRGTSKTEQPVLKTTATIENDVKSKSVEHKSTSNIDTESAKSRRSRSRSPGRRHRRSRSRSRERKEKRKRSRSRERRRSRSRDRKRSRERKRHRYFKPMASTSRSKPRLVRNSQEVKNIKTDVVISDSDSDDEFYSNYVGRKLQEEEIAGLQAEPIVLNFQDDLGIDKDDLDLSDMSDLEDEEVPFEIQLANKAKKQREALKKKLDKELNSIVDVCLKQSRGVTNHVNSLADLEQLQEDVAHMKCVQKRVADNVTLGCSYTKTKRTSDVAPVKSSNESRVVFKINDLDDYRFCKTKLTWGIDSTFGELRKYIAERRQSSVKATSLTINSHEIEDDKTPGDMQLNPDMVHTIDVLTVGDDEPELLTLKCIQKNDKPIVIHVDKSEKFSKIAEMIREKGAIFTKMLFDHDEVAANSTPSDLDMEDEDQLDLL